MQVKEIDIDTGKIKGYGICKKKYKISFLGGPTTPTYSTCIFDGSGAVLHTALLMIKRLYDDIPKTSLKSRHA